MKKYFAKFALVGMSGFIVNQGCLTLLVKYAAMPIAIAGFLAIELSIISNFLLNNFWTWREKKEQPFFVRFLKYHAVTLVSGGVNYIVLVLLTIGGMHYFVANLIGIGLGTIINFIFNHYWTFRS